MQAAGFVSKSCGWKVFCRESGSWRIIKHIIKPCEILEIVKAAGFVSKSCGWKVFCRESGSWRIMKVPMT